MVPGRDHGRLGRHRHRHVEELPLASWPGRPAGRCCCPSSIAARAGQHAREVLPPLIWVRVTLTAPRRCHRHRCALRGGGGAVPQLAAGAGAPAVGGARAGQRAGGGSAAVSWVRGPRTARRWWSLPPLCSARRWWRRCPAGRCRRPPSSRRCPCWPARRRWSADADLGQGQSRQRAGGGHRHRCVLGGGGRAVAQLAAGCQRPSSRRRPRWSARRREVPPATIWVKVSPDSARRWSPPPVCSERWRSGRSPAGRWSRPQQ